MRVSSSKVLPKVLVLGGLGFVGRHLCRVIGNKSALVYGIGHSSISKSKAKAWSVDYWVDASITFDSLVGHFKNVKFDAVVHCAGSGAVSLSYKQPMEDYHRSVTSVLAGLEFVRLTQSLDTRFVLASSAAVYGDQDLYLTEESPLNPISPYGLHKKSAEIICEEYSKYFGVKSSIVRLFSVYGIGLEKQLFWEAANKFKNGDPIFFGTGNEVRDWINVEDAARLLAFAALKNQADFEIYNGSNQIANTSEVLTLLAKYLNISSAPVFNNEVHTGNPKSLIGNNKKAMKLLGWEPYIDLKVGLAQYVSWFNDRSL